MSTLFNNAASGPVTPSGQADVSHHQSNSWLALLSAPLRWMERRKQRDALRDHIDNARLLKDVGLTREQAVREINKPFWR